MSDTINDMPTVIDQHSWRRSSSRLLAPTGWNSLARAGC